MNILITGASKRVGAACAKLLHAEGHNILIHYRASAVEAETLNAALNNLRPNSAKTWQADLLQMDQLRAMAEAAQSAWPGGLNVLINNASAFYATDFFDVDENQWEELFGSNLKAPFFLAKALASSLAKNNGCIINIIDIHAERGLLGYPVYSIAKAGLAAMTRVLAKELAPQIRVNGVSPGAVIWPEQALSDADKQDIVSRIALQRKGEPEDIAKAVRYLVQDAPYVTGQILTIDGGRTLFC